MPGPLMSSVLLAAGLVLLLVLYTTLVRRNLPVPDLPSRIGVFRYRPLIRWFSLFVAIFLPSAFVFLSMVVPKSTGEFPYVIGLLLLSLTLCLPLLLESSWYYLAVSPAGLTHRSAWRGVRSFPWDDIENVTYSEFNMWFVLRSSTGQKVRVPILVGELREFFRQVEDYLPASFLKDARAGYEKLGRPLPDSGDSPILEARPPR